MHKFLLAALLIFLPLFYTSEVSAAGQPCVNQPSCPSGYTLRADSSYCDGALGLAKPPNLIINSNSCPAGEVPSSRSTSGTCICNLSVVVPGCAQYFECPAGTTSGLNAAGKLECTETFGAKKGPNSVPACTVGVADTKCQCGSVAAGAAAPFVLKGPSTLGGGQKCDPGSGKPGPGDGILTAIGCVPTKPQAFVEGLLKYGTLAAGAIAFILMLLGALGLITAEGNPEAIKHSQERFYSAIIGLLFIIFAVLLMQVIGVDILGLPEFGPVK